VKQFRMEKETLDKTVRELTKNIKDATEELETARTKAQTTDRKLAKLEETRIE
jgi:prefoldin subunit 5